MTINPPNDPTAAFQYVPVPNEHVSAVYALLAHLASPSSVAATKQTPDGTPAPVGPVGDGWTDERLRAFLDMETKTSQIVAQMLDHLSENPGPDTALTTQEWVDVLGIPYSTMKILPTQITRTLGKHFPGLDSPMCHTSGRDFLPPRPEALYFWVTPERAAQWKALRG